MGECRHKDGEEGSSNLRNNRFTILVGRKPLLQFKSDDLLQPSQLKWAKTLK